jgi:hypothetical protein
VTDTIEPTKKQKQAAERFVLGRSHVDDEDIARLLAEREHKLREELQTQFAHEIALCGEKLDDENDQLRADLDAARATIAELKEDLRIAWDDCDEINRIAAASANARKNREEAK